jgi:hypothetical protein
MSRGVGIEESFQFSVVSYQFEEKARKKQNATGLRERRQITLSVSFTADNTESTEKKKGPQGLKPDLGSIVIVGAEAPTP